MPKNSQHIEPKTLQHLISQNIHGYFSQNYCQQHISGPANLINLNILS